MFHIKVHRRPCRIPIGAGHCRLALAMVSGTLAVGCWTDIQYSGPAKPSENSRTGSRFVDASAETPILDDAAGSDKLSDGANEESHTVEKPAPAASFNLNGDPFAGVESVLTKKPDDAVWKRDARNTDITPLPFETGLEQAPDVDEAQPPSSATDDSHSEFTSEESDDVTDGASVSVDSISDERTGGSEMGLIGEHTTRNAAWLLGGKWSLAAMANEIRAAPFEAEIWVQEAQLLAETLGVDVPAVPSMPESSSDDQLSAAILEFLLPLGRQLGRDIRLTHGPDHAALFEAAFKSNLLLVLYKPNSQLADSLVAAIRGAGQRSKLPNSLWQPLLDTVARGAQQADVDQAVYAFHHAVDEFFRE